MSWIALKLFLELEMVTINSVYLNTENMFSKKIQLLPLSTWANGTNGTAESVGHPNLTVVGSYPVNNWVLQSSSPFQISIIME